MQRHVSVLLQEAVDALAIKPDGTYVDLTLGRAGHSAAILSQLRGGHLYAFDLDAEAIKESQSRLREIGDGFTLIHASFANVASELASRGVTEVDGILADLGVSSPQFDDAERGFSYRFDARLDMRMDQDGPFSAYDVVNTYPLPRLTEVLRDYGDEPDAYRIAKAIVKAREKAPIETTFQLVDLIKGCKSSKALAKKGHPAKQTFQALRIEVNQEQAALQTMLAEAPSLLRKGGRLAIITFMSLDDRTVKKAFASLSVIEGERHGIALRPEQLEEPEFETLTRKPILPSAEELSSNPRSASAKLRVLVKK